MKLKKLRFRDTYMFVGGILVALLYVLTDPSMKIIQDLPFGASTVVTLLQLMKTFWFVGMLHASRRALFDYLDFSELIKMGTQTPEGAARIAMAISIAMVAIAICIGAAVVSN